MTAAAHRPSGRPTRTAAIGGMIAAAVVLAGLLGWWAGAGPGGTGAIAALPASGPVHALDPGEHASVVRTEGPPEIGRDRGGADRGPTRPAPGGGTVSGAWSGSLGGIAIDLTLQGPDDGITGGITSTFGTNTSSARVTGSFTAGSLVLADLDAPPGQSARYELTLSPDGRRLQGRVIRDIGGVKILSLVRAP